MGVRKDYRQLTSFERQRFVDALHWLESTGKIKEFADLHAEHFEDGIHDTTHFLPWHRELLRRFEGSIQERFYGVTIPYWDSSVDNSVSSPLWGPDFLGPFDIDWVLSRQLGSDVLPTPAVVNEVQSNVHAYRSYSAALEGRVHGSSHRWVGGVMNSYDAPRDPVFYLHHAWIDLLWVHWQQANQGAIFEASEPGRGINDPLTAWPNRTPAEVMDHRALGYAYDVEMPPPEFVVVPGVRELSRGAAGAEIRRAGLKPKFEGSTAADAWVSRQSPPANTRAVEGSVVTCRCRRGPVL